MVKEWKFRWYARRIFVERSQCQVVEKQDDSGPEASGVASKTWNTYVFRVKQADFMLHSGLHAKIIFQEIV